MPEGAAFNIAVSRVRTNKLATLRTTRRSSTSENFPSRYFSE
jgi:hypothetical protein